MNKHFILGAALAAVATFAQAEVVFNADTGTGFVGKGDVQMSYGWNDAGLQANASAVRFSALVTSVVSWECTNSNNHHVMVRSRTTTGGGAVLHEVRTNKQGHVTGFPLLGYAPGATAVTTDGPALNSCPASNNPRQPSPWSLTKPASAAVVTGGGLQVSIDGVTWLPLAVSE